MAGTTVVRSSRGVEMQNSTALSTRLEHNKLVDDVEVLRAALALANTKVNAIITAAATNIGAVAALAALTTTTVDSASDMTAAKVANEHASTTT